jgi:hypothetical protein
MHNQLADNMDGNLKNGVHNMLLGRLPWGDMPLETVNNGKNVTRCPR